MVVYINMEMPKSCYKCPMRRRDGMDIVCPIVHERFSVADVNILEHRLDNCPLVPVPPHGRLIDADAMAELWKGCTIEGSIGPLLDTRPTVIEAEVGEG